jgi:FAD/FMN-containing dehydrogenase
MYEDPNDLTRRDALKVLGCGALAAAIGTLVAGPSPVVDHDELIRFERSLGGSVLSRDTPSFESTRRELTWNQRVPDRAPDLIARVKTPGDVASAVRFARSHGLRVALRGSGHNYHAAFLRDRGMLIDMGGLKGVRIDAPGRTASLGPGVNGGELLAALAPTGLGFPVGHCPDVGLSGYLLGGGVGWNAGEWGPACRSVTGVDLVLASGEAVHADAGHNSDLYWAARGAGRGFFAAVTRYEVTLHDAPRSVRSFVAEFELDSLAIVSQWVDEAIHSAHPTVEVITFLSPPGNGRPALVTVAAYGMGHTETEAIERLGRLRTLPAGARLFGDVEETTSTFTDLKDGDGGFPSGKRMHGDMRFCNAPLPTIMGALKPFALSGSAAPSLMMCVLYGRKSLLPNQGDSPFQMTGPGYVGLYAFYDDRAADDSQRNWIRSATRAIEPYAVGSYISEVDLSTGPDIARRCYSPASWQRLETLKAKYDPGNVFFGYA